MAMVATENRYFQLGYLPSEREAILKSRRGLGKDAGSIDQARCIECFIMEGESEDCRNSTKGELFSRREVENSPRIVSIQDA